MAYGSLFPINHFGEVTSFFFALGSNDRGHIVLSCLFVCLLSTLTFAVTFELKR